jgi:hypothetical protein
MEADAAVSRDVFPIIILLKTRWRRTHGIRREKLVKSVQSRLFVRPLVNRLSLNLQKYSSTDDNVLMRHPLRFFSQMRLKSAAAMQGQDAGRNCLNARMDARWIKSRAPGTEEN